MPNAVWTILPYSPVKTAPVTATTWYGASASVYTANAVTNPNTNGDLRTDLMLMSCRQIATLCGGAGLVTSLAAVGAGATAQQRKIGTLVKTEKCTFVYGSNKGAPTFKAVKTAGTQMLVLYDMHYAEYNSGTGQPTLDATSKQPVPSAAWSTLKARVYDAASATYYSKYQVLPNVWGWLNPGQATTTAVDYNAKTWFPVALAAASIADQKAVYSTYNGLVTAYDGLRTTYDAAVKPSTAKPDFFATLFNPAKKTTVPLRPDKPTQPGAYAGRYQQPWVTGWSLASSNTRAKMAAQEFQVSGAHGGWGGFTMGLLRGIVAASTVQKSFGVFGWSTDGAGTSTYKAEKVSYTADWADMCFATTGTNGQCPTGLTIPTSQTTAYVAVSIWANSDAAAAFGASASGVTITFSTSDWAQNAASWSKPARPAAATALSTPAGAKALAASAAAAAAVAAALY